MPLTNPSLPLLRRATVTLTDAQIKALPTTPIQILEAQGVNKAILPVLCAFAGNGIGGNPYTNINADAYMALRNESDADVFDLIINDSSIPLTHVEDLLGGVGQPDKFAATVTPFAPGFFQGWGVIPTVHPRSTVENQAYKLALDNMGSGDLTGGDAEATLIISLAYWVFDLSTGEIE